MSRPLRFRILSGSSRSSGPTKYGLHQDSRIIEQIIRETSIGGAFKIDAIEHTDPYTFGKPGAVDVNIHLEVPCRLAWLYGRINIVVVNQEWWYRDAWNWALEPRESGGADIIIFKSEYARVLFPEVDAARAKVLFWRAGPEISSALSTLGGQTQNAFLYLIGASANKAAAAQVIIPAWRPEWPPLHVFGSKVIMDDLRRRYVAVAGVELRDTYAAESEKIAAQAKYKYHVVASVAEGFGYTFAEALAIGALPLWTNIGVYKELYGGLLGDIGKIESWGYSDESEFRDRAAMFGSAAVVHGVESLLALSKEEEKALRGTLRHTSTLRIKEFRNGWRSTLKSVLKLMNNNKIVAAFPPKIPSVADFPHVAIISLTYGRKKWFPNMANNILTSDYPPDKMTWIIADDSPAGERVDTAVAHFQSVNPYIRVRYLALSTKMAIGAKRNKACMAAPAECSVFMMMDDDDHYPVGSIRARMAYLTGNVSCVYCATLPMYDAKNYISAMNVPPLNITPAERVSEASLAFTREFFEARPFPASVSVAEGEGFIAGREAQTAEIPPHGIIVSFLHSGNSTSRRVPENTEPNGCHYGFSDEFFTYVSEVA